MRCQSWRDTDSDNLYLECQGRARFFVFNRDEILPACNRCIHKVMMDHTKKPYKYQRQTYALRTRELDNTWHAQEVMKA